MVRLYLDTLVFGLQKIGGVSVVWYEYIKRMLEDPSVDLTLLDINATYINERYISLDTSNVRHIKEHGVNLQVLRNIPPILPETDLPYIYQSTYLRTCKRRNVRNVIMIHDFTHQIYFRGLKKWLNTLQKWRAVHNADGIICVSENTRKDLFQYFPSSKNKKTTVIYNSASDEYQINDNTCLPERYQELSGKKYFIYVGDRFEYKNTGFLIELLRDCKELHCVLIGGSELTQQERNKLVGIEERVHHFTKVPDRELNLLYNSAHCMVYPSLYEGFGIPVLEAMKAGCPVIAFNNSSIPEVLGGAGILLENGDKAGCIKAFHELENSEYRKKIVADEVNAAEFFNWKDSYIKLIEFYKEIGGQDDTRG